MRARDEDRKGQRKEPGLKRRKKRRKKVDARTHKRYHEEEKRFTGALASRSEVLRRGSGGYCNIDGAVTDQSRAGY